MPLDHQIPNTIPIVGTIAPAASADTYPITNPAYGLGGFRTVTYAYELTSIPMPRRELGMVCYVSQEGQYYALSATTDDSGWTPWPDIDITNIVNNFYNNNITNTLLERVWYLNTGQKNPQGDPFPAEVTGLTPYPLSGAWLDSFNNQAAANGPYNVIDDNAGKHYIPIDLTKGNTAVVTVSSPAGAYITATYGGFVLVNNFDVVTSGDVFTTSSVIASTFEAPSEWLQKAYTFTVYVKHSGVMADLPLVLHNANIQINSSGKASSVSATPIACKWSGGTPPALYDAPQSPTFVLNTEDIFMFTTRDAGKTWYGFVGGVNFN